jgi:hypothetical protein
MPRESNRRSYTAPKIPVSLPSRPAPTYSQPQAPAAPAQQPQERPGFFSNMWQGFGLGAGQAIAHNMFRSNPLVTVQHVSNTSKEYEQCMKDNNNDKDLCKQFEMK